MANRLIWRFHDLKNYWRRWVRRVCVLRRAPGVHLGDSVQRWHTRLLIGLKMSKLNRIDCSEPAGVLYGYMLRCPGCGEIHMLPVGPGNGGVYPRWDFNGDVDKPTFGPSVLARGHRLVRDAAGEWTGKWELDAAGNPIPYTCHSFVEDGRIRFLTDCTHALAGQTVGLPDWTEQ